LYKNEERGYKEAGIRITPEERMDKGEIKK